VRKVIGILHGRVDDGDLETIMDVDITGIGRGKPESVLGTAVDERVELEKQSVLPDLAALLPVLFCFSNDMA
jgi:hypothetical protein